MLDPVSRGDQSHIPPERVMTRLMRRRHSRARAFLVRYLLLGIFIAGVVAGLFLATRG